MFEACNAQENSKYTAESSEQQAVRTIAKLITGSSAENSVCGNTRHTYRSVASRQLVCRKIGSTPQPEGVLQSGLALESSWDK